MEYHDNGICPDKVSELFAHDYPPGLDEAIVAKAIAEFCRRGNRCELNELEDLFKKLQDIQRQRLPGTPGEERV